MRAATPAATDPSVQLHLSGGTDKRVGITGGSAVRYTPARIGVVQALVVASDAPVHVPDPLGPTSLWRGSS